MRKGLMVLFIVFVLCMSVASAYIGQNRGYGRYGTMGQPYAGSSYGTVDSWNTGLGYNRGFGRDGGVGRYGTGYKNYYRPARYNTYAFTGHSSNFYNGRARFSTFGRLSYNPSPRNSWYW
jgi:hypothetical protein